MVLVGLTQGGWPGGVCCAGGVRQWNGHAELLLHVFEWFGAAVDQGFVQVKHEGELVLGTV